MKVIFIGQNGPFTMAPLHEVAREHEIVGIVESAPRNYKPKEGQNNNVYDWIMRFYRNNKSVKTLKSFADNQSIPFFFLTKENSQELVRFISNINPDIMCVASMSQLLKKEAYSLPKFGTINFHPALLPNYRGPNPWFWQYFFMEEEVGATIHYIDDGEDTGDILKQGKIKVRLGMHSEALMTAVIELGAKLMLEALEEIKNGTVKPIIQCNLDCPHRARNVKKDEQLLDWNQWSIERMWHVLRGTTSWIDFVSSGIPGLVWSIQDYCKCSTKPPWGRKVLSLKGWYLSHPEGRIYIRPKVSIKAIARAILS